MSYLVQTGHRENHIYVSERARYQGTRRGAEQVTVFASKSTTTGVFDPSYEEACEIVRRVMYGHGSVEFVDAIVPVGGTLRYRFNILSLSVSAPEGATR